VNFDMFWNNRGRHMKVSFGAPQTRVMKQVKSCRSSWNSGCEKMSYLPWLIVKTVLSQKHN
jgi:hypothetical protein